jgi:hypothetical protein
LEHLASEANRVNPIGLARNKARGEKTHRHNGIASRKSFNKTGSIDNLAEGERRHKK